MERWCRPTCRPRGPGGTGGGSHTACFLLSLPPATRASRDGSTAIAFSRGRGLLSEIHLSEDANSEINPIIPVPTTHMHISRSAVAFSVGFRLERDETRVSRVREKRRGSRWRLACCVEIASCETESRAGDEGVTCERVLRGVCRPLSSVNYTDHRVNLMKSR